MLPRCTPGPKPTELPSSELVRVRVRDRVRVRVRVRG